jgi:hypothetical protein
MKKTATLLCILLAGCVVDETDPDYSESEAAVDDNPGEELPEEYPPEAPTSFVLTARTTSSVTMRWATPDNVTSTKVQRRFLGGAWTTVKTYDESTTGLVTYTSSGMAQDTLACYRVAVYNDAGADATAEKCAVTLVTASQPLSRVRLEIRVADVDGAGTTDRVGVSLNDTQWGNFTGLNYSINDFGQSSTFKYDLDMEGIPNLHDIANITIRKYGNDTLCLRSIKLLLDEVTAVSKVFGNTSTTCRSINGPSTTTGRFSVSHAELRATSSFINWVPPTPTLADLTIPQEQLEERLEGIMGDMIWSSPDVHWGEKRGAEYVEVSADEDPQSIDVDYDLEGKVSWSENPEVDVKLTLRFDLVDGPDGWQLLVSSTFIHVFVDLPAWEAFLINALGGIYCGPATGETCEHLIEDHIAEMAEAQFDGISMAFNVPDPTSLCPGTPTVAVNGNGDLVFGCDF